MAKTNYKKNKTQISQAQASYRKEFYANIKRFLALIGHPDVLSSFNKTELEYIYKVKVHKLKVVAAPNSQLPKQFIEEVEKLVKIFQQNLFVTAPNTGNNIPLDLMMCEGYSFLLFVMVMREEMFENASRIKETLKNYLAESEFMEHYQNEVVRLVDMLGCFYSKLDKELIWMKHDTSMDNQQGGLNNTIVCYYKPCESKLISIEGGNRPAYRLAWGNVDRGVANFDMKPSQLGLVLHNDLPMPIYIQNHTFARLEERVGLYTNMMHYWLLLSFVTLKVIKGDFENQYLIEYRLKEHKVGYFVAGVYDGILVVRTFLFLIYNGTPEGKRLQELSGLQKSDTQYLALTSLSDFLCSDLFENHALQQLFIKAGCESLIALYNTKEYFNDRTPQSKADFIQKYLSPMWMD